MSTTRRWHRKSRVGCLECKRRRLKCDESSPSCSRCETLLQKCIYPPAWVSTAKRPKRKPVKEKLALLNSPLINLRSPSPSTSGPASSSASSSSFSQDSTPFNNSTWPSPAVIETLKSPRCEYDALRLSDNDLYQHYLEHTSQTFTLCPKERAVWQKSIPGLALQSKTVFHSLFALSAICMCHDMISKEPQPSIDIVDKHLITGYRFYNLASEQMRDLLSESGSSNAEFLLASTLLLVPFAAATQQIKHWLSGQNRTYDFDKLLSSTPRDVIVMMRGVRTLQTLAYHDISQKQETIFATNSCSPLLNANTAASLPRSRTHPIFPILAATSEEAFSKLRQRVDDTFCIQACSLEKRYTDDEMISCVAAFELIARLRTETFSSSASRAPQTLRNIAQKSFEPKSASSSQFATCFRYHASKHAVLLPTEPLTRSFLSFYVENQQAYLDLVLPLLDQRLETPIGTLSQNESTELTKVQALALDIYAHWSVLMILVGEESWWIGNLPRITLAGMINRYGDGFVAKLWPENLPYQKRWWPGSMLTILQDIQLYR